MDQAFIYVLKDPVTLAVRYVGKASDVQKRLASHLRDARRRNTPVYLWIRDVGVPIIEVIEGPTEDWAEAERKTIIRLREQGCDLLNLAKGGNEPHCPLEVRQANGRKVAQLRVSTPLKKRVYELRRDMGRALRRGEVSEESKKKLGIASRKRPDLFPDWTHF